MTSLQLFVWIALLALLQAVVLLAVRGWRVRRELQSPQSGSTDMVPTLALRVAQRRLEDPDGSICSLYLEPADSQPLPMFQPGQFVTLVLPRAGRSALQRCYSLSDRPRSDHYRISVKRVPGGQGSNHVHDALKMGDVIHVRPPSGQFFLAQGDSAVVLIAGGIGITPMLSMLAHVRATQPQREVRLLYGVRHGGELAFGEELATLCRHAPRVRLQRWFSAPRPSDRAGEDYEHAGRITVDAVLAELPPPPFDIYLCGPGSMMTDLITGLRAVGVADSALHLEAFGPASLGLAAAADPQAQPQSVTFAHAGKTVQWSGTGSLLELAEEAGVDLPSACRSGSCGTCQTPLRHGEVRYFQTPEHTPAAGTCLPCICHPATAVVLQA